MFLLVIAGGLAMVPATLHERLADALEWLSPELVVAAADFLGGTARIRVCGINPHAGENGLFGDDDERITTPAVAMLQHAGINATGPLGGDLMLAPERRGEWDAFVAMIQAIRLVGGSLKDVPQ
ncbi:MAG TPA: 4-hydroxythreonine-4-phosphate dehydrogenase PdxA [Kribbella sp.]